MGFSEGIKVATFCISMVFALLAAIYVLVKLTSAVILRIFSGHRIRANSGRFHNMEEQNDNTRA